MGAPALWTVAASALKRSQASSSFSQRTLLLISVCSWYVLGSFPIPIPSPPHKRPCQRSCIFQQQCSLHPWGCGDGAAHPALEKASHGLTNLRLTLMFHHSQVRQSSRCPSLGQPPPRALRPVSRTHPDPPSVGTVQLCCASASLHPCLTMRFLRGRPLPKCTPCFLVQAVVVKTFAQPECGVNSQAAAGCMDPTSPQ